MKEISKQVTLSSKIESHFKDLVHLVINGFENSNKVNIDSMVKTEEKPATISLGIEFKDAAIGNADWANSKERLDAFYKLDKIFKQELGAKVSKNGLHFIEFDLLKNDKTKNALQNYVVNIASNHIDSLVKNNDPNKAFEVQKNLLKNIEQDTFNLIMDNVSGKSNKSIN